MWRERAIRWAWFTAGLNLLIALMNVGFSYGHFVKHEYWRIKMIFRKLEDDFFKDLLILSENRKDDK